MARERVRWVLKLATFVLGLALVAGAVVSAVHQGRGALAHVRHAPAWLVGASVAMVLANLFLTAAIFHVVTRSFDADPPVRLRRMWDLTCAATLLNYLPLLRAGMVGRTAYLKLRHALPIHQGIIIAALVFGLFAIAATGAAALVLGVSGPWQAGLGLAALGVMAAVTGPVAGSLLRRRLHQAWLWLPLRVADVLAMAGRFWVAFRIVGHPIDLRAAIVFGAADMIVSVLGITPNGLGLAEWTTGAMSTALAGADPSVGQLAKLVDRGISIAVLIPVALWSLHCLRKPENERRETHEPD
jgi:hypothetical protein